ncbi:MAG: SRPBCC family protein [Bacteroidia bacterium]|nr:SRPBCC family protein [Bacteroidia bacterium]
MKYIIETIVNLSREEVVAKFMDEDSLKHWMEGLKSIELIDGVAGEKGAKSIVKFDTGKRKIEMEEIIVDKQLPDFITMQYNTKQMVNTNTHNFIDLKNGTTRLKIDQEFKLNGIVMKLMGVLMKGMFKKQSKKYSDAFKAFAEEGKSVLDY